MPAVQDIDSDLVSALKSAEKLATRSPDGRAVVYRRAAPDKTQAPQTYCVRLDGDDAPLGAAKVTTVTRRLPELDLCPGGKITLPVAVRQVAANLPDDVQLLDQVSVEYYAGQDSKVFAFQFMSTAGRNVATWVPDLTNSLGVMMHMGSDGRGRPWADSMAALNTRAIGHFVRGACVASLEPAADVSDRFHEGWRFAEAMLQVGVEPSVQSTADIAEVRYGFDARMAREHEDRMQRIVARAPAPAAQMTAAHHP